MCPAVVCCHSVPDNICVRARVPRMSSRSSNSAHTLQVGPERCYLGGTLRDLGHNPIMWSPFGMLL